MDNNNLSDAMRKLYNCVSTGLGAVMLPQEVRNILDKEVAQLSMSEEGDNIVNGSLQLYYDGQESLNEVRDVYKRTCSRMLYQEMRKQVNIESVVNKAKAILDVEEEVSQEEVNEDWLIRFFNSVQDVSAEEMQILWGRILAGEIKLPNSFSLRTMDAMTKISQEEAKLFEEMSAYIVDYNGTKAILGYGELNDKYSINYGNIVLLNECGLMESSMMNLKLGVREKINPHIMYGTKFLKIDLQDNKKIEIPIYRLTRIGQDILKIIHRVYDENYFNDVALEMAKRQKRVAVFSVHNIVAFNEDSIEYEIDGEKIATE